MTIIGVDLKTSPRRPSTAIVLDDDLRLVRWRPFTTDRELLQAADSHRPRVIAIGAPLNLPAGLCCLEPSCECEYAFPDAKGRQCELELSRLGISCFFTSKSSIVRGLILRSVEINRQLNALGFKVIEVYPYATKMLLFGDNMPTGKTSANLDFLRGEVSALIPDLLHHADNLDRDACDAALNAYTGYLHTRNQTDMLGDATEGLLVIPKLPR